MGKSIRKKSKDVEQYDHVDEEERGTPKEMENYVNKNVDNDNDYCTHQYLIGCRDLFRGVMLK